MSYGQMTKRWKMVTKTLHIHKID